MCTDTLTASKSDFPINARHVARGNSRMERAGGRWEDGDGGGEAASEKERTMESEGDEKAAVWHVSAGYRPAEDVATLSWLTFALENTPVTKAHLADALSVSSAALHHILQWSCFAVRHKRLKLFISIFDVALLQYLRNLSPSSGLCGPMEKKQKPTTLPSNDSTTDLAPAIYRINCELPHNHLHNVE